MRNRTQTYNRSLALCLCVETLTQQFEEVQQLRNRVRKAEAKAICVSRYQLSCRRGNRAEMPMDHRSAHRRSLRRHWRVGSLSKGH
jgi:hypothetical protein